MYSGRMQQQRNKIRPPRRGITGSDVDFDTTWATIASAIRQIHTKNASDLSYEALYRHTYRVILKKKGQELYNRVLDFEKDWLRNEVKAGASSFISSSLLLSLNGGSSQSQTTTNERRLLEEKFLRGVREQWQDYQLCMTMLTDVLMYMERVFCQDNRKPSIYTTSLQLFRDHILRSPPNVQDDGETLMEIITQIILDQIHMERTGDVIDKHLIKSCTYMLESLFEGMSEDINQRLYVTSFEPTYLEASHKFYKAESEKLLRESDAGGYCRHTSRRIREEVDRCKSTLSETSTQKIEKVVEDELIANRIRDLIQSDSGVKFMIANERLDDLGLVYDLNARVDSKKTELVNAIQKQVVELGSEINKAAIAAAQAPPAPAPAENGEANKGKKPAEKSANTATVAAIKWVEDVLVLKDRFDAIWRPLLQSFTEFINSSSFPRSSEYISLFIDENMKKGIKGKTESEVDVVLEKAIRYYKKHLCRRLLMSKSLSNEVEKQMISRMKIELGNNFTTKLEAMFKDMAISEELTNAFKSGQVEEMKKKFEIFYGGRHSGRTLTWLGSMGSADIRATFPKVPSKEGFRERKHEINVSTYAMIILMLFNDVAEGEALTFEEIQAKTNIPAHDLVRNLQSLAVAPKTRVLIKEPMSKDVKPTDRFLFNAGFVGKFHKLKIGVVTAGNKVEGDRERRETEDKNNDERRYCIEAAVVRIMKQRKELPHSQLVSETVSQLTNQFKPDINMIKKRIEALIEREFLERIEDAPAPRLPLPGLISNYRWLDGVPTVSFC
ncbi:Cullin repeat-like-containing domain protein [Phyllosticta capitalensis]